MDAETWNRLIASLPGAHILQTWEWGQVRARFGWEPVPKVWYGPGGQVEAAALVLLRSIPIAGLAARMRVVYVPKGPLLSDWGDGELRRRVLEDLRDLARAAGGIFVKIDPDVRLGEGVPGQPGAVEDPLGLAVSENLRALGWRFSEEQVQFRNTVLLDLTLDEEQLLARMKPKTRYNIRLAARRGVSVRAGSEADLDGLYRMYAETAVRDAFVIREQAYYREVWGCFLRARLAEPLIAEVSGEAVAGVVIFRFGGKAWYLHGMSRPQHRGKMPNHLLQWEAIRRAKGAGCTVYDLWGAPDQFTESDALWGVYRFKEGFGGQVVRHIGAWDLPVRPLYYWLYTQAAPRLFAWMRRRGRSRTRAAL